MALQPMYPGQPNSPQTELAADITADDTTIPLLNAAALPPAPNLAVIGSDEMAETVLYAGVEGNNLTGVTRGFQGTARSWGAGTKVARNFTAYDYDALRENLEDHASATTGVHGATSAATPNTIVQRDANQQAKFGTPTDAAHAATKGYVDGTFLPASQYTAQDVLAKLLTVDGAGSGLDADLLDGVHGSGYFRHYGNYAFGSTGDANNLTSQGFFLVSDQFLNLPVASYGYMWVYVHEPNNYVVQRFTEAVISSRTWERTRIAGTWGAWKEIWDSSKLRWNASGYLEYNDGWVWKPIPVLTGSGSPEGVVTAPVGFLYLRTDGGTATTLYVKESGTGNTGWVAK